MLKRVMFSTIFLTVPILFCYSLDLGNCADDLDSLKKASSDASETAEEAEDAKEEFENCKNYPDTYDLMKDGCRSQYEEYKDKLSDLEDAMENVRTKIKSVNYSCGVYFSVVEHEKSSKSSTSKENYKFEQEKRTKKMLCDLYRDSKNKLPFESLLKICMDSGMSKEECVQCIK